MAKKKSVRKCFVCGDKLTATEGGPILSESCHPCGDTQSQILRLAIYAHDAMQAAGMAELWTIRDYQDKLEKELHTLIRRAKGVK